MSGTGAGAASLAACTDAGRADSAGVHGLVREACRLLGLRSASMSLSENPWRSGMHDGSTKGILSSKISTSLWYAISPVKIPRYPDFYQGRGCVTAKEDTTHAPRAVRRICDARMVFGEWSGHLVRGHDVAHGHVHGCCLWPEARGQVGVLEDASAVRFHLLDEVLNVPLHCMPVEFDRVKHDLVLAAPRFEAVSVHKFSCAIAAYGLGSPQSAANSSRCCQGSSRVRVLITAPRLDPTSSTTSA